MMDFHRYPNYSIIELKGNLRADWANRLGMLMLRRGEREVKKRE